MPPQLILLVHPSVLELTQLVPVLFKSLYSISRAILLQLKLWLLEDRAYAEIEE